MKSMIHYALLYPLLLLSGCAMSQNASQGTGSTRPSGNVAEVPAVFTVRYDGPIWFDGELTIRRSSAGDTLKWRNPGWGRQRKRGTQFSADIPRSQADRFWAAVMDSGVLTLRDLGQPVIDSPIFRFSVDVEGRSNEFVVYTAGEGASLSPDAPGPYNRLFDAFRELSDAVWQAHPAVPEGSRP